MKRLFTALLLSCSFVLNAQWQSLPSGVTQDLLTVEAVGADTVFAAGSNVLIKSTNSGATWTTLPLLNTMNQPITNTVINDLHFFNGSTGIAVCSRFNTTRMILRSTDGGLHWSTVFTSTDASGTTGGMTRTHFINDQTGWAVGSSGIICKTTNGGLNWTASFLTDVKYLYDVQWLDNLKGMVCGQKLIPGSFSEPVLFYTSDGGAQWTQLGSFSGYAFVELCLIDANNGLVAGDEGQILSWADGAAFQSLRYVPFPDLKTARRFHVAAPGTLFALTDFAFRTTNNAGDFWKSEAIPAGPGQELQDFDFLTGSQVGYVVGKGGRVFKTANAGAKAIGMANFNSLFYFCKGQPTPFENPAPAGEYTSEWYLDNQLISTDNDVTITFPQGGTTYTVKLRITGANGSSEYEKSITTEADIPPFNLGEIEWVYAPPVCAGGSVSFKINHPAPNVTYTAYLNGQPFQIEFPGHPDPLYFVTTALSDTSIITVEGKAFSLCETRTESVTLDVPVIVYPNKDSPVETSTPIVCKYGEATITIRQSETGAFYLFTGGFTGATPIPGNGGDLTFQTPLLDHSDHYQIIASRDACQWPLNQTVFIEVDDSYRQPDTLNMYGMVGQPIKMLLSGQGAGSVQWNFGSHATPATSTAFQPSVVFNQSGLQPFTFEFQSQGACRNVVSGTIPIYASGPAFTGNDCQQFPLENFQWVNPGESPQILASTTDTAGNLLVTGARFQPVGWWQTMNIFLQKNNPAGQRIWELSLDPLAPEQGYYYRSSYGTALAVDPDNNIFISGTLAGDKAQIFGQNFSVYHDPNKYYPQGFLMMLNPEGQVKWSISIQSNEQMFICAPSSLIYSEFDHLLHLFVHGPSIRVTLPDGWVFSQTDFNATGWLLSFEKTGQLVDFKAITGIPQQHLLGGFHPPLSSFNTALSTYTSPRLSEGPNGALYLGGWVGNADTLYFGQKKAISRVDSLLQRNHHFMAVWDRPTQQWKEAYITHTLAAYGGLNDQFEPKWRVDSSGNVWLAFGMLRPEQGVAGTTPQFCSVGGSGVLESMPNRAYVLKYSPDGQLLWQTRSANMYYYGIEENGNGGMYLMSDFIRAGGFQLPTGAFEGAPGPGGKDVLLTELSAGGDLLGIKSFGGAFNDQPVALTRHKNSGELLMIWAPDLNEQYQNPNLKSFVLQAYDPAGDCPVLGSREANVPDLSLEVQPNPVAAGGSWRLLAELPASGEAILRVWDMTGQLLEERSLGQAQAGAQEWGISLTNTTFTPGVFVLELKQNGFTGRTRLVIVR